MSRGWGIPACALLAACSFNAATVDAPAHGSDAKPAPDSAPPIDVRRLACVADGFDCPDGGTQGPAFSCNGSCWITCVSTGSQDVAEQACEHWNGTLAIELSGSDHDCVAGAFTQQRAKWLGLELPSGGFGDAGWRWITDPTHMLVYADWDGGTSGSNTGPLCALQRTDDTWQTDVCDDEISSFICERAQ